MLSIRSDVPLHNNLHLFRLHLANLDKLLQKQPSPSTTQLDQQDQQPQPIQKESDNEKKSKNLIEGLGLARLWPEMKATEEMSPTDLNRLQRLSSKAAEYSPRDVLGSRSMEYYGSNDWKGLIDELHQNKPLPSTAQLHQQDQQPQPIHKESNNEKKSKNIIEGLRLATLWPEMKAPEEMSPRHLNRLLRLLSKTAEYSPRNVLGSRWMEYHGSNDWKGLLDPLDENLRREVARYGEFVQAAYHSFHSDPAMSAEEPPMPRRVVSPDRSYKVTKSLYATSSVGLPKWVDDVAPDLGWMTQRSSWIGYVAVCDDRREIARMGRRDIVISLRGTATCPEWAENLRAQLTDISTNSNDSASAHEKPKVECGFLSLYKTRGAHVPSLAESVIEEVKWLMEEYKGETLSITVTGHSLGAGLALLVADEISTCSDHVPPVAVISFGGPRVGNKAFGKSLTAQNVKVLRVVNSQDVITRVPGMFVSEEVEQKLRSSKVGGVMENMGLGYTHVGVELRVDTKMSPYLKPDADMACCHDLEAYLHLVDGYLASNCPFRANAKRSLARLMKDQTANVKKLYTSKAKALRVNLARHGSFSLSSCLPSPS